MVLGGEAKPSLDNGGDCNKHDTIMVSIQASVSGFNWYQMVKFVNSCKFYACFDCVVINHQKWGDCNEHGTIYAISSDFGDRMTTQSMELMVLLREHL